MASAVEEFKVQLLTREPPVRHPQITEPRNLRSAAPIALRRPEIRTPGQNSTRSPNWISLAGKDPVAKPNPPLLILVFMPVRLTLLNTLKNSARNSIWAPSCPTNHGMCVLLVAEKSVLIYPGPTNVFRPRLPIAPWGLKAGAGKRLPHLAAVQAKTRVLRN